MKFTINSLNEFICCIKDNKLDDYYFRGENTNYPSITSSLLRNDKLLNSETDLYAKTINAYYEEIATRITDFERKDFLAFSQHHRLNTNLIDIRQPLNSRFRIAQF